MTVDVVNCRNGLTAAYEYVGRPSPLGNPFMIGHDGTRDEVIVKYREWLRQAIQSRPNRVAEEITRLRWLHKERGHLTLACWCVPLPCHASVIREAILGGGLEPV